MASKFTLMELKAYKVSYDASNLIHFSSFSEVTSNLSPVNVSEEALPPQPPPYSRERSSSCKDDRLLFEGI